VLSERFAERGGTRTPGAELRSDRLEIEGPGVVGFGESAADGPQRPARGKVKQVWDTAVTGRPSCQMRSQARRRCTVTPVCDRHCRGVLTWI